MTKHAHENILKCGTAHNEGCNFPMKDRSSLPTYKKK